MAVITPGVTFASPPTMPTVNAAIMNLAISGATVTQVNRNDMASTLMPVIASGTAPTGIVQGQLWYDTTYNQLRMYTASANWLAIAGTRGQRECEFVFTVGGLATLGLGMPAVVSSAVVGRVTTSMTTAHGVRFIGIATQAYTDGQMARLCHQGFCQVLMGSVSSIGHVIYISNAVEGQCLGQDPAAPTVGRPYIGVLAEASVIGGLAWAWIWGGPIMLA